MLAIDSTQPPPLSRKASIFRRFTRRERPLEISSPIIAEVNEPRSPQIPQSPPRSNHSSRPSTDTTSSTHSRVSRNAHATSPFPHNTRIGAWDLFLPPSQVHALYTGFYPESIADQWFVFSEGPDVNGKLKVHFHRAWTGLKVAELFVVMDLKGEGAGKVVGIKWDGGEQTSWMVEEQAKRTVRGGCKEALGIELEGEEF
ncbi:hypothetical protein BU25DRAFT_442739 [Macroventuria anomochaeta]|uniref:Uncharacterized protein n=1 Tax=Macroventuria anomochaeta TaxID=301207 RepID=A0ACB6RNW9_9PLEO|nr:uncharacterized protein BU25DRAFT_442739 [Macroventuria anomochaeta]KAF2623095.1 hypothetical protein BU25DRAFT_442739 [Macroventuria anomochaeta]